MRRDAGCGPGRRSVDGSARRPGRPEPGTDSNRPVVTPSRAISADFTRMSSLGSRGAVASQQARLSEVTSQLAARSGERPASRQGSQTAAMAARSSAVGLGQPQPRLQRLEGQAELLHRQDRHAMGGKLAEAQAPAAARARRRRTVRRPAPRSAPAPARSPAARSQCRSAGASCRLPPSLTTHIAAIPEPPTHLGAGSPCSIGSSSFSAHLRHG